MKKLCVLLWLAACGGSGGGGPVDDSKLLSALTPAEANAECNYTYDTYPPVMVTCPGGATVTKGETGNRATDCNATTNDVPTTCTATVGQAESCFSALYDESDAVVCASSPTIPPACAPLFSNGCAGSGSGRTTPSTRVGLVRLVGRFFAP